MMAPIRKLFPASLSLACVLGLGPVLAADTKDDLQKGFLQPPDSARPWVYWFVMDGNLNREGITADFEALKRVGIGGMLFMEVDVGIPKGPIKFMSPPWRELFKHANSEAARLGLQLTMPASPGWTGSGGPWVKPEQSMQKLVFSETNFAGPGRVECALPQPQALEGFYRDVAVLAFPTPAVDNRIEDIDEKALYRRGHYSSEAGVKALIPPPNWLPLLTPDKSIHPDAIMDISDKLDKTGRLVWDAPDGQWTVLRFGHTSTGANTRPAPEPGLGLECDKFDKAALESHFDNFLGKLMADIGPLTGKSLVGLHIDSWEMGPQNWTAKFPEEFRKRRGYGLTRYLPVMTGRVVGSREVSERFLWDLRQTALELIADNHASFLAELAHRHGMKLSIEPYDGTPCDDMTYGARADIPMGEFWRDTFETWFSCTEASSIAHTYGQRVVQAEAFTSGDGERWLAHPASLKALGDWAFCEGINKFVFHRYAHQPWLDRWPGMTMGPYGIHYDRTQTWFEQSKAWNEYLSRCQFLLQQGLFVADVCFLKPEASPQVFRAPASAVRGNPPERLGYNFDALTPEAFLTRVSVKDGRLVLPDGMSYRVMVLPETGTMTPALLRKVFAVVQAGATVVGPRPYYSPSLAGYPQCDAELNMMASELWGDCDGGNVREHAYGKGRVFWKQGRQQERNSFRTNPLIKASWIWHKEGNPAASAPVGKRYFLREIQMEKGIASARVCMTADNSFELWVNGIQVGAGNNFHHAPQLDVLSMLKPGKNVLAVAADNGGDSPNPAGLLGALLVKYQDGRGQEFYTDRNWLSAAEAGGNWRTNAVGDRGNRDWQAAMELGPMGMAPWGMVTLPVVQPEIYGDFGFTTHVLEQMGVPPDFESDGPFRYIHRRAGDVDVYFVANKEDRWVGANCAFRVSGKVPELWNPRTGAIVKSAVFQEKQGRVSLPLWLEPSGSVFVVFSKAENEGQSNAISVVSARRDGRSLLLDAGQKQIIPPAFSVIFADNKDIQLSVSKPGKYEITMSDGSTAVANIEAIPAPVVITGSWDVRFQPKRGAPEQISFDSLDDWSKRAEAGIKYFSGNAVYRKQFDIPSDRIGDGKKLVLDLGKVQVMARVTLNDKHLAILWKQPFQVDVTGAAKAGANALEIEVVNLWPNRLIGDQLLPENERVSWTTWNPFAKDAPLLESGLLGPVSIGAELSLVLKKSSFH